MRLYAITRADLSPGQQAVQAAHAAVTHAAGNPDVSSLPLVILAARDELGLFWLLGECERSRTGVSAFYEPDLDGQLTAVAFVSDGRTARRYPLAFKEAS